MNIELTPITSKEHWESIAQIQTESYAQDLNEDLHALKHKQEIPNSICRVGLDNGQVVAYVLAHPFDSLSAPLLNANKTQLDPDDVKKNEQNLFLHDFCMSRSVQGKGLGKRLVNQFFTLVKEAGFKSITLVAVQDSMPFWKGLGFSESDCAKSLKSYGNDVYFMSKKL